MREYAKIAPQFWIGPTGKAIKELGVETQLTALYLLTNPHATMIGIYYLPLIFIAHEAGIPLEGASAAIQSLCEIGFCSYDAQSEYIWVHKMALFQIGEQLKPNDNRVKGINETYHALPHLTFLNDFYAQYKDILLLEQPRENRCISPSKDKGVLSPSEAPSKPGAGTGAGERAGTGTETRTGDGARTETGTGAGRAGSPAVVPPEQFDAVVSTKNLPAVLDTSSSTPPLADEVIVFEHWKAVVHYPDALLDEKRKCLIQSALRLGYSVQQLCEAITGCSLTPHNSGNNEYGQRFDGLQIILRDGDQIDRFIRNARHPPQPLTPAKKHTQTNIRTAKNWLHSKNQEEKNHGKI